MKNLQDNPKNYGIFLGVEKEPCYNEENQDSYLNARLFAKNQPLPLLNKIDPYADQSHLVPNQNAIRAKGLQENQLLVVKWCTRIFLGTELMHLVNGRVAWFLAHLMDGNLLELGWCSIEALMESLRHVTNTGGFPLPILMSQIVGIIKKLKTVPEDHETINPPM